ncbi:MAG TPA: PEP-CTERM sorting domain-containing protein [Tepidisphaeraceae bacterium]|jgi:hypothetical protein
MRTHFHAALLGGVAGFMLLVGSARAQNLLANPNMDTAAISTQTLPTPVSWNASATKSASGPFADGMSSESFANVLDPSGLGLFFKPFQGNNASQPPDLISATISQDVVGTAGQKYTMTGWAGAGTSYIGLTDSNVKSEFRLLFLNSSFTVIGGTTLNLATNGLGSGAADPPASGFGYHQFTLSGTAPAGTLFVRAQADMLNAYNNPAGGDQAFVVDTFSLTVPEPATLGLASFGGMMLMAVRRRRSAV